MTNPASTVELELSHIRTLAALLNDDTEPYQAATIAISILRAAEFAQTALEHWSYRAIKDIGGGADRV